MSLSRHSRVVQLLNYRLRVTLSDGRTLVGQMLAFDKHMNLVLCETEEFRRLKASATDREEKRTLGLVVLRGDIIVSIAVAGPPPASEDSRRGGPAAAIPGPGLGRPAGRGLPVAAPGAVPLGLGGPIRGIGGPGANQMNPMGRGAPPPFGMPPPGFRPQGMPPGMPPGMPGFRPGMPPMPPGFRPPPGFLPGMPPPQ